MRCVIRTFKIRFAQSEWVKSRPGTNPTLRIFAPLRPGQAACSVRLLPSRDNRDAVSRNGVNPAEVLLALRTSPFSITVFGSNTTIVRSAPNLGSACCSGDLAALRASRNLLAMASSGLSQFFLANPYCQNSPHTSRHCGMAFPVCDSRRLRLHHIGIRDGPARAGRFVNCVDDNVLRDLAKKRERLAGSRCRSGSLAARWRLIPQTDPAIRGKDPTRVSV